MNWSYHKVNNQSELSSCKWSCANGYDLNLITQQCYFSNPSPLVKGCGYPQGKNSQPLNNIVLGSSSYTYFGTDYNWSYKANTLQSNLGVCEWSCQQGFILNTANNYSCTTDGSGIIIPPEVPPVTNVGDCTIPSGKIGVPTGAGAIVGALTYTGAEKTWAFMNGITDLSSLGACEWGCEAGYDLNTDTNYSCKIQPAGSCTNSGSGSELDPIVICTCPQLQDINSGLSLNYILGQDIDCSNTKNWADGNGFNPIGCDNANLGIYNCGDRNTGTSFSGVFDGNNNTISGVYINRNLEDFVGVFGDSNGVIKNINFNDLNIIGNIFAGGLIGKVSMGGVIIDSNLSGTISGYSNVGGIVGDGEDVSITGSSSDVNVWGVAESVGGLVGSCTSYSSIPIINNTYSIANVTGTDNVGGLIGNYSGGGYDTNIKNSYAIANVTGVNYVGGLIGIITYGVVNQTYSSGIVTGVSDVGGLIGKATDTTIINSYSNSDINGIEVIQPSSFHISQLIDNNWNEIYVEHYPVDYVTKEFLITATNTELKLRLVQKNLPFGDIDAVKLNACGTILTPEYAKYVQSGENILSDILEIDKNVIITHEKEIELVWNVSNYCDQIKLQLTASEYGHGVPFLFKGDYLLNSNIGSLNIDGRIDEVKNEKALYNILWEPGTGHPDGNTYIYARNDENKVYFSMDITMDNTDEDGEDWAEIGIKNKFFRITDFDNNFGMCIFGVTDKVNYKHVTCEFIVPKNEYNTNKFLFRYYGTGATNVSPGIGGLVGSFQSGSITNSYATGDINGYIFGTGGLVGQLFGTITNSYFTGDVNGSAGDVGGLVGLMYGNSDILDSNSIGQVYGVGEDLGGLVGEAMSSITITNSFFDGNVFGENNNVGGLIGTSQSATISKSYSVGNVSSTGDFVGGLVGSSSSDNISCTYSQSIVNGGSNVGGLIGVAYSPIIDNSYASGNVNGGEYVGGFVGDCSNCLDVNKVFSVGSVTGTSNVGGVMGNLEGATLNACYWFNNLLDDATDYFGVGTPIGTCNEASPISYFYDYSNAPMNEWDFEIWSTDNNTIYFPTLR